MATYSWHRLTMKKVEIGNLAVSQRIFLKFFLQKCFLSSPVCFLRFLSKSLNLIGCHGDINCFF